MSERVGKDEVSPEMVAHTPVGQPFQAAEWLSAAPGDFVALARFAADGDNGINPSSSEWFFPETDERPCETGFARKP